jgi:hypothetical protein
MLQSGPQRNQQGFCQELNVELEGYMAQMAINAQSSPGILEGKKSTPSCAPKLT